MPGRTNEGRLQEGRRLLEAAALVDTRSVAARLLRFKKAHQQYESLCTKVGKAESPLSTQQTSIAEADVTQDEAVEALAKALVADGQPRANPFKAFGVAAPSVVASLGYAKEAKECLKLAKATRRKGASKGTTAAAAALEKAAKAMQAALVGAEEHAKPLTAARAARDASALAWETAYAALRRGAKAAEDDGAKGLASSLFGGAKKPAKRAKKASGGETPAAPTPTA